jgi:thiamine biosynthesis lipoprotein
MISLVCLLLAVDAAPVREMRMVMGSTAEVAVVGPAEPRLALDAAFQALSDVDDQMSLFKESPLTALNRAGEASVPPGLVTVLQAALEMSAASKGAFDITVEPFVRAAGFLSEPGRTLTSAERKQLLGHVGARHVHVEGDHVRLDAGTTLDLGGIAKGYAADLAIAALRESGATQGMVDLGSSSISIFGTALSVTLRDPERGEGHVWGSFHLENGAVSSSGVDQKKGHIIDPRNGEPAARVEMATVVARTGIEADALSTAVFVLGADEGLKLAAARGADALVLVHEHDTRIVRTTPGFAKRYDLKTGLGIAVK